MRKRILIVVVLALLASLMCVPVTAVAGESPHHYPVSGEWSFWGTEMVVDKAVDGNLFFHGSEHGAWAGTFGGTSTDYFFGKISKDGYLWAIITVNFEGCVGEACGQAVFRISVYAPTDAPMYGRWTIVNGSGGLEHLHGMGTWVFTGGDAIGYADYEGEYWLLH